MPVPTIRLLVSSTSMSIGKTAIDAAFVEEQRQRLLRLRASLLVASRTAAAEEAGIKEQRTAGALEAEEDAQSLDALEREENLVARDIGRVASIDRALKKIEEGTYGLSDRSGEPIPRERLAAVPDALYTLSEERALEGERS
jgi:DnaK suppressor protein